MWFPTWCSFEVEPTTRTALIKPTHEKSTQIKMNGIDIGRVHSAFTSVVSRHMYLRGFPNNWEHIRSYGGTKKRLFARTFYFNLSQAQIGIIYIIILLRLSIACDCVRFSGNVCHSHSVSSTYGFLQKIYFCEYLLGEHSSENAEQNKCTQVLQLFAMRSNTKMNFVAPGYRSTPYPPLVSSCTRVLVYAILHYYYSIRN